MDYADNTDRAECVHGILHCLPACVREVLDSRMLSELGVRSVFAPLFDQGAAPQKATRRGEHALQQSRDCGTKHNRQNLRKLATASSSCGELRKLLSIAPARLPQRSSFFIPAFELEYHTLDVSVVLVPPQEL